MSHDREESQLSVTDELLRNNEAYAESFDKGLESFSDLDSDVRQSIARIQASPFIPHKDAVRGFVYEVETGRLREVT